MQLQITICIGNHSAKFQCPEALTTRANNFTKMQNRTMIIHSNTQSNDAEDRQEQQNAYKRKEYIHATFHHKVHRGWLDSSKSASILGDFVLRNLDSRKLTSLFHFFSLSTQ